MAIILVMYWPPNTLPIGVYSVMYYCFDISILAPTTTDVSHHSQQNSKKEKCNKIQNTDFFCYIICKGT